MTPEGKLIYVASPYSSADKAMQEYRAAAVAIVCGWLFDQHPDVSFFSPISHTHPIAMHCKLPGHWQFWAAYDHCMLSRCDEMWVFCLDGWLKSSGVTAELEMAKKMGLPIRYIIPHSLDIGLYEVRETAPV